MCKDKSSKNVVNAGTNVARRGKKSIRSFLLGKKK